MPENLIRLKTVPGIGNAILWRLLRTFGNADGVFGATGEELAAVRGMTHDKARCVLETVSLDPRPELERAARAGVNIIPYDDPAYPKPLLHSFDPPVVLYVKGRLVREDQVAVGIVGTRRASPYGRENALALASALARGGYAIVSGLALGVDTFAHIGAMNVGGRTLGVLGCGFDHMYPEENRDLALEMTRCGAVLSEFPMATPPSRDTFPTRNRIIAGLSLGVVVIEAPLRSGALITARLANEIGRTVFAVPGRVGDVISEGCNRLIRDGAVMVTGVDDIFNELNPVLPLPERPIRERDKSRAAGGSGSGNGSGSGTGSGIGNVNEGGSGHGRGSGSESGSGRGNGSDPAASPRRSPKEKKPEAMLKIAPEPPAVPLRPAPRLNEEQKAVLAQLTADWRGVDDIVEASGLPAGKVGAALSFLRLARLAEQGPGQTYRKR